MATLMSLTSMLFVGMIPRSAAYLYARLLDTVENAPLSFFTSTDVGQIVNRFSQDLSVIDMELPFAGLILSNNVCQSTYTGDLHLHFDILLRYRFAICDDRRLRIAEVLPAHLTSNQTHGSRSESTTLQQFSRNS